MIPAPLGFPADNFPLCANYLPISLGSQSFKKDVRIQVAANAKNTPINAVIGKTLPAIIFNIGIPPNYLFSILFFITQLSSISRI